MELIETSGSDPDVVVERAVLRASFPGRVDSAALEEELAAAWAGVVGERGGRVDVLRVAHAFDPRWHDPLGRPANRGLPRPSGPLRLWPDGGDDAA